MSEDVLNEVKVINSVLKNKDKNALFGHSVDDLFVSYGDVWAHIKSYHDKYGTLPTFDLVQDQYSELEDVDVSGKTEYYMDSLRDEYMRNRVENIVLKAAQAMKTATPQEIKEKLQTALGKLDRFQSTSRDLSITDFDNAARRYEEVRERSIAMGGTPGVPTGIDFIDACMPLGMQGGDVMSIIGYPARGKSILGAMFAANAITKGYKPLIFTREMSAEAVQDRIFTILGSGLFSNTDLMLGVYNKDDYRTFSDRLKDAPQSYIVDGNGSGNMTPNFMRGKIDQHRPDFVLLDYMQLFQDNRNSEDMTPRMRNLSLEIKDMSNQTDVPVVVISSATPPDGGKVDGPPNVERSAWSRQLAYDSTVSFAVHRHDESNLYQIECAKNRYGPLFSGFLDWDVDRGTYEEKIFNI